MIYLMDEPFECFRYGKRGWAVAYRSDTGCFVWCRQDKNLELAACAAQLDPPPPIPAAARQPKIGEVWMWRGYPAVVYGHSEAMTHWYVISKYAPGVHAVPAGEDGFRPATPEEAELFRFLLDGLKRSLGEE